MIEGGRAHGLCDPVAVTLGHVVPSGRPWGDTATAQGDDLTFESRPRARPADMPTQEGGSWGWVWP